jgi:putative pyruvate formate lyase activating enzyme
MRDESTASLDHFDRSLDVQPGFSQPTHDLARRFWNLDADGTLIFVVWYKICGRALHIVATTTIITQPTMGTLSNDLLRHQLLQQGPFMTSDHPHDRFTIPRDSFRAAYLDLHDSGELRRRASQAVASLEQCMACPRNCGANRLEDETGTCRTGRHALVSSYFPHMGEENCLRGWRGSGTIFFSMCNLRCVFCQNFDISHEGHGRTTSPERIAGMMLELQAIGCHNINFVTPAHNVAQILEALLMAVDNGLRIPLVYNTSAYDGFENLQLLDGIIDIYMPDFKIWDPELSLRYFKAEDYPEVARAAIKEMHHQVGALKVDEDGIALRGVLVRHLVMPDDVAGSASIMQFLAQEVSEDTFINIMRQYRPAGKVNAGDYAEINRRISSQEYQQAFASARQSGLWRFDQR